MLRFLSRILGSRADSAATPCGAAGGGHICPVCGWPGLAEPPRSPSGGASHESCPSCGFEFGYTDDDQGCSYEDWRQEWIATGMRFAGGRAEPHGWDPRQQLKKRGDGTAWIDKPLSRALVIWSGRGISSYPIRDPGRLVEVFGEAQGGELAARVLALQEDFYRSDAYAAAADLSLMGEIASREFSSRHPEIDDDGVRALAWCYTFDNK